MTQVAQEIPKIGLVMEAVKVVRWLKEVGDDVVAGEPLLEVESEKSIVEIEAAVTGRLTQILVPVDAEVTVGVQVAWIESAEAQPATPAVTPSPAAKPGPTRAAAGAAPSAPATAATARTARDEERIRSSPVARKLAAERGVALASVAGTGPGGRIQLDDVRRAADGTQAAGQALSPMRRALARAMTLSNAAIPQFNVSQSVDWTVLQSLRREFIAALPDGAPKISVNDFLLSAVARALMEFPGLNATFSGDPDSPNACIVPASGAHIGLVIAVDNGLLVPVIHDVERLGVADLARRREECVDRALKGRLKREEMEGATFSISNLGAQGPDRFTALINPPQSAILAVGRQRECVVAREGIAVIRPQSELTLTVDHRIADGRLATQFLTRLVSLLEARDWRA